MEKNPTIGIIGGRGRMGKLFADFFKERGLKVLISDIGTKLTNKNVAQDSDITIIAVPINKTEEIIKKTLPHIRKNSAIMDLTSIKGPAVKAMLKGNCEVLGMHPMFGASNPIPGQTIILCPTKKSGFWSKWMTNFLGKNQIAIENMSVQEHDKIMNIAQGLIHFVEITFADSLRQTKIPIKELFKFTGKASELKVQLAARILDQDPDLYGNIQIKNPHALKSLKLFQKSVDKLIRIVEKKDLNAFKKYFLNNREYFGNYTKEAYKDSSYLIGKLLELQKKPIQTKTKNPSQNSTALLGPANTFSDIAATKYLNKQRIVPRISRKHKISHKNLQKYFARNLDEIFDLVEKGKVKEGIVPIENNIRGTIRETVDNLFFKNVHIIAEIDIPIHHTLIVCPYAKKSDIKQIISHSQPLTQCKNYLKKHFPKVEKQTVSSTAAAIEKLLSLQEKSLAVIAPETAAKGLKIFARNIEDDHNNKTIFIVIRKGKMPEQKNSTKVAAKTLSKSSSKSLSKTSIAFHFSKDAPGTLFHVFKIFANAKINLTKIESRPTKPKFGNYIFYLDFEGAFSDPKIKKALKSVQKIAAKMKVLGSY